MLAPVSLGEGDRAPRPRSSRCEAAQDGLVAPAHEACRRKESPDGAEVASDEAGEDSARLCTDGHTQGVGMNKRRDKQLKRIKKALQEYYRDAFLRAVDKAMKEPPQKYVPKGGG